MMKYLFLVFALAFSVCLNAQVMLRLEEDSLIAYAWTGGDEFNASNLNNELWVNGIGGRRVLISQELAFDPRNVVLRDSVLQFIANRQDSSYLLRQDEVDSAFLKKEKMTLVDKRFPVRYSAGAIVSRKKFHYGLYEIRFKVDEGRGVWPAFWFYGGNQNEEIDVFELKGEKNNRIHVDTHCPDGCDNFRNALGMRIGWGGWLPVSDYLQEGFNTMTLEWKPEELIWYFNGHTAAHFKGKFSNPMKVFLNTSVAKTGGAFSPGPDENTKWPVNYYVDYFRTWKQVTASDALNLPAKGLLDRSLRYGGDDDGHPTKKSGPLYSKKILGRHKGFVTLTVNAQGRLSVVKQGKWEKESVTIKVNSASGNRLSEEIKNEASFEILPGDAEVEVIVSSGKKQFTRKMALTR